MRIRSIPPSVTSRRTANTASPTRSTRPRYTRMRTTTLENLLTEAESRLSQLAEVLKVDAADENIARHDKLLDVVMQLKSQIGFRKGESK